jgi:hypothetical protein
LLGDQDVATTGRRIVLPASFPGGVRHMQHSYQNSMAIVRTLGKSDYFITFTVNPNWEEIQAESNTSIQYTALDAGNAQTCRLTCKTSDT